MSTMLTWCEECGEDMHVNGGRSCKHCDAEFCYNCIKEHESNCFENPANKDDE